MEQFNENLHKVEALMEGKDEAETSVGSHPSLVTGALLHLER